MSDSDLVHELVWLLDVTQRVVIFLYFWEQLNEREIAEKLACDRDRVHQIKRTALTHMRNWAEHVRAA